MHWETDPLHIVEPGKTSGEKGCNQSLDVSQVGHQVRASSYPSFCSMK